MSQIHIPQELFFDRGYTINVMPWSDGWVVFAYMARDGKVTTSPPPHPLLPEIPYGGLIPAPINIAFKADTVYVGTFPSFQAAAGSLAGVFAQLSGNDKEAK